MSKLSLFVFVDAFGWRLLERHGFMEDELPHRQPLRSVLGYSCTCIPTILTGRLPREHGHLSFFRHGGEHSPLAKYRFLSMLPRSLTRRGRVRRMISKVVAQVQGFTGYFQLYNVPFDRLECFDYTEKKDLYQPGGILSGHPTIFDALRSRDVAYSLSDWTRGEASNLHRLETEMVREKPRFAYLYLASMDAILHQFGTDSSHVEAKIREYERELRKILGIARQIYSEVNLFVFSDHGMTDIREECDLKSPIEDLGLEFGRDYVAMYDSTMARFWFMHDEARAGVHEVLAAEPRGRVLERSELTRYGCDFANDEYGETFFLLDPGVLLCPSYMSEQPCAGMHGFDPDHEDTHAMLASSVEPGTRPRGLEDLFDLMLEEVGLGDLRETLGRGAHA